MPGSKVPSVYIDASVYLNVLREEEGFWRASMQVLRAAYRRDIQVIASRLLPVETGRFRGDRDREDVDAHLLMYLESVHVEWLELDLLVSREARRLSWQYEMKSASDAVHLATAVHAEADYFMSDDKVFPYGETVGKTKVVHPQVVWDPTMEDAELEADPPPPSTG